MRLNSLVRTLLAFFFLTIWAFAADNTPAISTSRIALEKAWHIQSGCKLSDSGAAISQPAYSTGGWLPTTVPHTVLGAEVDAKLFKDPFYGMNLRAVPGTTYPLGKIFANLPMPDDSPYKCSWWYRTEFHLPAHALNKALWLHFDGINYRANIWLNGRQIANSTQVAGAYRGYEFNVHDAVHAGTNALAVEVFAQTETDLGINFVDWNPAPADKSLGLWRPVYLTASGDVAVRYPSVSTHFTDASLSTAELSVTGELTNASNQPVSGTVETVLEGIGSVQTPVTLAAGEHRTLTITPAEAPVLTVHNPKTWWPYGLGPQNLLTVEMLFRSGNAVSDTASAKFGIREITAEKTEKGYELFRINGHPILIRGGGWAPDMFLRVNSERMLDEFRHVRNIGLNTIRLEGKIESDEFFDLADRMGILIMPGWCCCDHWEHWDKWKPEDHEIAKASMAYQAQHLRSHPSVFVWLYGSDNPPPEDVESEYIAVLKQYRWPNPYISSASAKPTTVTGESGVKMSGPYDYVPPSYWLRDTSQHGGAWGFNTETSPGPAPPVLASQLRFIPKENLWPHDDVWNFHAGLGSFAQTNIFDNALAVSYGPPTSAADYDRKSQVMTYDAERAMFEAYTRNKYNSTGVIQWMLNNAWPSVIWHLYDYYLVPGGGYFGAKKANELVHAQYSFDDGSVAVTNGLYETRSGLTLRVRVLDTDAKILFDKTESVNCAPDSVTRVLTIPDSARSSGVSFVRLDLSDAAGKTLGTNTYWLPDSLETLDWQKTNYFVTPAKYSDLTTLAKLRTTSVEWTSDTERHGDQEIVRVHLRNTGQSIAFQVRASLHHPHSGEELSPILWDDNFVTLLPGESQTLTAVFRPHEVTPGAALVHIEGWNLKSASR